MTFKRAYILFHDHRLPSGSVCGKLLGQFPSEQDARAAMERYRLLPGFDTAPDDFVIVDLKIGHYAWSNGFDPALASDELHEYVRLENGDLPEYVRLSGSQKVMPDRGYLVQHEYEFPEEIDHTRLIGAFATKRDARRAVGSLKKAPGFRDYKRGFYIADFEMGQESWTEGYITVHPDDFSDE